MKEFMSRGQDLEKDAKTLAMKFLQPITGEDLIEILTPIVKIFEKYFSFSSRFSRFLRNNALPLLDFHDIGEKFLLLLSIGKILEQNFSFSSRLWDFDIEIFFLVLNIKKIKFFSGLNWHVRTGTVCLQPAHPQTVKTIANNNQVYRAKTNTALAQS